MDQVDSDNLIGALQVIIKKYAPRIKDFAPVLLQKLLAQFARLTQNDEIFEVRP